MSEADVTGASPSEGTEDPSVQEKPVGPGAQLAAQREAQGWTIEQVANQLNMATRQIQALESNNYAALPGMVVVRGFLRSYAKLLKLDPTPLLAMVREENPTHPGEAIEPKRALSAAYTESSLPPIKQSAAPGKGLMLFVLLIALLAAGWLAYQNGLFHVPAPTVQEKKDGASPQASSGAGSASEPVGETVQVPAATASVSVPAPAPAEEKPQPSTTVDLPMPAVGPSVSPAQPVQPTQPGAVVSAPAVEPPQKTKEAVQAPPPVADPMNAPAGGKNNLVLNVRQDTWVEIRRADKVVLVSRLLKAGSTATFDVVQPVALTIGNAAGVDASLRGKPLDLKAAKNNVIRLEVK